MPAVVIEVVAEHTTGAGAEAMVAACSASLPAPCSLSRDGAKGSPSEAQARVRWDEPELHADIDVGVPDGSERRWAHRRLAFSEVDAPVERWRSVGLTVAALATELSGATPEPTARPPREEDRAETTEPAAPPPARPRESGRRAIWLGLAGVVGPALGSGSPRFGGVIDVAVQPTPVPWFVRLGLGSAVRPTDERGLFINWNTFSLGVGATLSSGTFRLEPRMAFGVEAIRASASDPAGHTDSKSHVAVGIYGGVDGVLRLGNAALVGTFDAWHLDSKTTITIEGAPVGAASENGWIAGLGARAYFAL